MRSTERAPRTSHEQTVRLAVYRVGVALGLVNLVLASLRTLALPGVYRPGSALLCLALLGLVLTWGAAQSILPSEPSIVPIAAFVVLCYVMTALHPVLLDGSSTRYPPMFHVLGAGMCLTAVAFGVRASLLLVPSFALIVWLVRVGPLTPLNAGIEAILLCLSGLIVTAVVFVLDRATAKVGRAVASEWVAKEAAARASRRSIERVRWDGVIHDRVLGALLIAGRAAGGRVSPAARELARSAVAVLDGESPVLDRSLVEHWQADADRLGLTLVVRMTGDILEADVRDAVLTAGTETLTNIARHSGQQDALVEGAASATHVAVTISDNGQGFSGAPQPHRSGLRSVSDRMNAVGGKSLIRSTPSGGTSVSLVWDAYVPLGDSSRADWTLRTFAPTMALGAAAMVLNIALGAAQWLASPWLLVAVATVVAIPALTTAIALAHPDSTFVAMAGPAVVGLAFTAVLNTPAGAPPDWRYWYLGALTPACGALAFRCTPYVGLATVAAALVAVAGADVASGREPWGALFGPGPVLIMTAVAGHMLRLALNRSWDIVSESMAAVGHWRMSLVRDEERASEAGRRVASVARIARAELVMLAAAEQVSTTQQRRILLVEAAVRDGLVAPGLMDDRLGAAILQARQEGAEVEIVEVGSPAGVTSVGVADADDIRLLECLVGSIGQGDRLRVQWKQPRRPNSMTASYVGADPDRVEARFRDAVRGLARAKGVRVNNDGESILFEF